MRTGTVLSLLLLAVAAAGHAADPDPSLPHLRRQGTATQLMVGGKPFLMRGGELGNSTATNATYLLPFWSKFADLNMNGVLVPVYWDLVEPQEGHFDFSLLDSVIGQARDHDMRLVLLWFASWKNSMSCYAPAWVKRDPRPFPRAADLDVVPQEILSPFSKTNRDTDARAFAALQKHLREVDGTRHTVVMVQVENEIGMIPTARDHSPQAESTFASAVPAELMSDLTAHQERLAPELRALWQAAGGRRKGTWAEVFGGGPAGEEVFMAWHFARYTDAVAAAVERGAPPSLADGVVPGDRGPAGSPLPSGGLVLATAPEEFIVGGTAVTVTFTSSQAGRRIGILSAEEGRFVAGKWENVRWLSGDETHQGRHIRLEPGRFSLQRVRLYAY